MAYQIELSENGSIIVDDAETLAEMQKFIRDAEETFVFGLQEQMGSREGYISRYETMTQKRADEINARMGIDCIKWVRTPAA